MTGALEIIRLRFTAGSPERLIEEIRKSISKERQAEVIVYTQVGVSRDISIHLHHRHDDVDVETLPSAPGLSLAEALKAYGMVEHTVWREAEKEER